MASNMSHLSPNQLESEGTMQAPTSIQSLALHRPWPVRVEPLLGAIGPCQFESTFTVTPNLVKHALFVSFFRTPGPGPSWSLPSGRLPDPLLACAQALSPGPGPRA